MNKRLLLFASVLLAVGALVTLGVYVYIQWEADTGITEQDYINARKAMQGETQSAAAVAPAPVDPSRLVRVAVGGLGLAEDLNHRVGDLIVAELAGARGLDLVERQSLDKVLREVELNLSGLVRAKDAVRVGKLVKADWFLLGGVSSSSEGNAVVARIVDAHSGIMRDVAVIKQNNDAASLARELGAFVRQCRQAASAPQSTPPAFLAIGVFADMGINNRLVDLPARLRSGLTAAYQTSKITLLEREHVSTLLREVRLDLAGLTEDGSTNQTAMQSAMWLVDGYYQSFETSDMQVELVLRVNRVFGRTTAVTIRAPQEEALIRQVKESVDKVLAKASPSVLVPTRRSEIKTQMGIGEDILRANFRLSGSSLRYSGRDRYAAKDLRNLEEAIRAFETVLLLDSEHREARMQLAACFRTELIGRREEALNYYQEIIGMPLKDQWTTNAMLALGHAYYGWNPREAAKWFHEAGAFELEKDALARGIAAEGLNEKNMEFAEAQLIEWTRGADQAFKTKNGTLNAGFGMLKFMRFFGTNHMEASSRLVVLMPKLKETFPAIVPHLLAAAIQFQVDTNSGVIAEFRRSLQACVEHPDSVTNSHIYFESLLQDTYDWCMDKKFYLLAVELGEAKRQAAAKGYTSPFGEEEKVKLGFAYRGLGRWKDAMDIFESFNNKPIDTRWSGARWEDPFLPSKAVEECRAKLGMPVVQNPNHFDLGAPCLHLHAGAPLVGDGRPVTNRYGRNFNYLYDRSSFAVEGNDLWVARSANLFRLDFTLKTNLSIALPKDIKTYISALCIAPGQIWIGTEGMGLIEYDKSSGQCRRLTEKDGLLLDAITCLHLRDQSLWIGYGPRAYSGNKSIGGIGVLDLRSHRFTSFTPPLPVPRLGAGNDSLGDPPRSSILGITAGQRGEIWVVVSGEGLQRYRISENTWATIPRDQADPNCLAADDEHVFVGLDIIQDNYEQAIARSSRPNIGLGGVMVRSLRDGQVRGLSVQQGLPVPQVSALAVDGSDLWIGGRGYVAVADIKENKVRKVSYVQTRSVDRIQVAGGYVWVQFDGHLYRTPLKDLR